jgi:hypothetical protein
MAALTDLSDLINRQTGGNSGSPESLFFFKLARVAGAAATAPIAGRTMSLWRYEGMPNGGAVPTTAEILTRSSVGAMPFLAPGGGREKLLVGAALNSLIAGTYVLYDRLFQIGGFDATVTTDLTVQGSTPTPALTRNTGGVGNFAFVIINTQIGTTATTLTMTYTNQNGTTGRTSTVNIGNTGFREATRAMLIPLAAGDTGIRAVEKVKLTASTGTAGNFGIVIGQPLATIPVGAAGVMGWRDYTTGLPGIPAINENSCLSLLFTPSAATAPELFGSLSFVEK